MRTSLSRSPHSITSSARAMNVGVSSSPSTLAVLKTDGHLGRCHLKGRQGDAANVILTAVGHNLRLVLARLRALCRLIVLALLQAFTTPSALKSAS
jgi:hypothetical protein